MPFISDCPEWAILNALKHRIQHRTRYFDTRRAEPFAPVQPVEELEASLRAFLLKVTEGETIEISNAQFEYFQTTLKGLCSRLDQVVNPHFRPAFSGPSREYSALYGIVETLATSNDVFDLVTGPGRTLFKLSEPKNEISLTGIIKLVAHAGILVSGVVAWQDERSKFGMPSESEGTRKSEKKPWKDTKRKQEARHVIDLLLADLRARCPDQISHNVLLQIPGYDETVNSSPGLDLMISSCPDTSQWVPIRSISAQSESMSVLQSLCKTVQENIGPGKYLCLYVAKYLLFGEWCAFATHPQVAAQTGTLAQLIAEGLFKPASLTWANHEGEPVDGSPLKFTPMEKRKLALQLGYCLMDFFNAQMSSQHIYFFSLSDAALRAQRPYLSFPPPTDIDKGPSLSIYTASILSFAELLLEIEIGETKPPMSRTQPEADIEAGTWSELNSMVIRLEQQNNSSYTQAIRGCLAAHIEISQNQGLRGPHMHGDDNDKYDGGRTLRKVRRILYKKVIRKLEDGLEESIPRKHHKRTRSDLDVEDDGYHQSPTSHPVAADLMSAKRRIITLSRRGLHEVTSRPISTSAGGLFDDTSPAEHLLEKCNSADRFIRDHRHLYETTFDLRDTELQTIRRVKIAVLDTGCDTNHPRILAQSDRIKGRRTWVRSKKQTDVSDSVGHGTHVTSLLFDIAPDSDIYISQVTDSNSVSSTVAAEAVLHAIREWKVDIITMSFGFITEQRKQHQERDEPQSPETSLTDAILEAHHSRVLLFAAASNSGAYGLRPTFPARYAGVMCIYSGDGLGNSAATNPTSRNNDYNFLTLGESVESAWPVDLCGSGAQKKRKSGTSFATPIAAGIAACLMLDARRLLSTEDARRLNEYDKMKSLLSHLSKARNGYHVIDVKEYFEEDAEGRRRRLRRCLDGTLL